jgi:LPXTG-motif cell wall-anchored protein
MTDIIIIGVVVLLTVGSIVYARKRKKEGKSSCGGSCGSCSSSCPIGEEK